MVSPLALIDLHTVLTTRATLIPVTGGVMAGFAVAMFRGSLGRVLLLAKGDQSSLMNFSSSGTLRCICGEKHPEGITFDRRHFCRSCGCEVVAKNVAMLDKHLSRKEIKAMTSSLRHAAIRASHLELPATITTVSQLNEYLASSEPKHRRDTPSRATQVEESRVH